MGRSLLEQGVGWSGAEPFECWIMIDSFDCIVRLWPSSSIHSLTFTYHHAVLVMCTLYPTRRL